MQRTFWRSRLRLSLTLPVPVHYGRLSTKPYYVSTPIFYVNAVPHIGHLYTSIIGDVLARYARLKAGGNEQAAFFNTGTDEHGLKIQRAAETAGLDPKTFCDQISTSFKDLATAADIEYSRFMRTTDPDHIHAAQHFWKELQKRGMIYKGQHSGWYSISDECFYTESQIQHADGTPITLSSPISPTSSLVAIESGSAVEWSEEENFKFRMSSFREPLLKWLNENPRSVYPPNRKAEILDYIHSDPETMRDLSISRPRSRLQWGIPVPGSENEHTMYVWIEALVNYLTAVGYPWKDMDEALARGWPTNVHVVGKDITRFHSIIFPSLLLALDLPLPKTILVHGHWTMDHLKMSKSRGNVANPFEAMDAFGVDAVRYYLMRVGGNFRSDSDWSEAHLRTVYNHDLRNQLGNLLARTTTPRLVSTLALVEEKLGSSPATLSWDAVPSHPEDAAINESLRTLKSDVDSLIEDFEFGKALERVQESLSLANEHINRLAWWKVDIKALNTFLSSLPSSSSSPSSSPSSQANLEIDINILRRTYFYTYHTLRLSALALRPFMPSKSAEILAVLGYNSNDNEPKEKIEELGISAPKLVLLARSYSSLFPSLEAPVPEGLARDDKDARA